MSVLVFGFYGYFEETNINGIHVGDPARFGCLHLPGQRLSVAHQLNPRRITDVDAVDLGFLEIAVNPN